MEFNDKCQRCLPARTQSLLAWTTSLAAQALHRGHYHRCLIIPPTSLSSTKVLIMIFSRPNFHPYQNTMIKADTDQSSRQLAQVSLAMVRQHCIHDSIWWQSWKWSWLMMTMKIIKIIFQSSSEPHIISNSLNRDSLDLAISKKRWWWWIRGFYGDRQNEEMRRCDNKQCRLDNQAVLSKDMIWRWYIFSIDGNDIVI